MQFDKSPDAGVPKAGVTNVGLVNVGLVPNTKEPEPVSSLTADAKLADEGVAKKFATPEPKPVIPVASGRPEQFVNVPDAGVPSVGVVIVGLDNVGELKYVICWVKFVPSLHTATVLPAGIATPVPFVARVPMLG